MTTGEKITKLRKQAGYSQETFSELMGVSRQAVSKWENDTARPANENLQAICKLFGVSLSRLLDDEDITINSAYTQNLPKEVETNKKVSFVNGVFTSGAVLVLSIALITQSVVIKGLKKQLANTENYYHNIENRLSRLESRMDSAVYSAPSRNTADFVDSDISVKEYDFENDTATLKFSFIPTDYSRSTVAKVGIKSSQETKEAVATLENGMFTAHMQVKCRDDISTYVYLVDGENTRSFSMGMIENPAAQWTLDIASCRFGGKTKESKGVVEIDGYLEVEIEYFINPADNSQSVYPQKAVIEIYDGERLIKSIPHTDVMEFKYNYTYDDLAKDNGARISVGNWMMFSQKINEKIEDKKLNNVSDIRFVYVLADNRGHEYRRQAAFVVE